jgi:hypothetical protein
MNDDTKNAYVLLQIDNNEYISASLVLADSLRKTCTGDDLVIMINDKINDECVDMLKKVFDKIVYVKKISNKMSVNKLLGLELEEYDKIIIIDSDSIIFKNIDFLFKLEAPSLLLNKEYGSTGLIILNPNKKILENIKKNAKTHTVKDLLNKEYKSINYLDEKILESNNYSKKSFGIQYNKEKPFTLQSDIPLEERIKWNYFNMWFYFFKNLINKDEDLSKNKCIKNVIELSKNYLPNIIKFMTENENVLQSRNDKIIKKMYNLSKGTAIKNYHTNTSMEYKDKELSYNINDYITKDIISYYNKTRHKNIKKYDKIDKVLENIDNTDDKDNFLNMYIRAKLNTFVIIDIDDDKNNKFTPVKSAIYVKKISENGDIIKNILFDIDTRYTYKLRIQNLILKINDDNKYYLRIQICENISNTNFIYDQYGQNTIILNDMQSKIRISSILLNDRTLEKYKIKKINTIKNNKLGNINKRMIKETIKKWIYNNYGFEEIERIFICGKKDKIIICEYFKKKIIDDDDVPEIFIIKKGNIDDFNKIMDKNEYYEIDGIKYFN